MACNRKGGGGYRPHTHISSSSSLSTSLLSPPNLARSLPGDDIDAYSKAKPNITFVTTHDTQWGPYVIENGVPDAGSDDLLSFCTEQDDTLWEVRCRIGACQSLGLRTHPTLQCPSIAQGSPWPASRLPRTLHTTHP